MANRVQIIVALGGLVAAAKARGEGEVMTVLEDAIALLVQGERETSAAEQRRARDRARKTARVRHTNSADSTPSADSTELAIVVNSEVLSSSTSLTNTSIPRNPRSDNGARPTAPRRRRNAVHNYTPEFEAWWAGYPAEFRGSKHPAFEQWWKRLSEGHRAADITAGRDRYIAHCRALDRHLKHASTFLGPELHFTEPWPVPHAQGPRPATETEEQRALRMGRMRDAVEGRKGQRDGDQWWDWVQEEARESGATTFGEILAFAYKQLKPETAHAG